MRVLTVLTVLILLLGLAPLPPAHAESPAQGQAVGILVLVGLLRPSPQAGARPAAEKPKPALAGGPKAQGRAADVKSGRLAVTAGQGRPDQLTPVPR